MESQKQHMKKFFRTIHLYLSLACGLFVMLACLTGSILVFEQELMQAFNKERYFVREVKELQLPLEQVLQGFKTANIGTKVLNVKIYNDPTRNLEVGFEAPKAEGKKEGKRLTAFVNPYTGEVAEVFDYGSSFFAKVETVHRRIMGSNAGKLIMGVSTLLFLFIMISGVILWWPKNKVMLKQRLSIKWKAGWKRLFHDLHYSFGIYSVLFLFVFAFTALAWSFQWFNDGIFAVTRSSKEPIKPPVSVYSDTSGAIVSDDILADAYTRIPNAVFYNFSYPKDTAGVYAVTVLRRDAAHETATDNHYYDQYSGAHVKTVMFADRPLGQRVRASFKPIHISSIWGIPSKIIGFIVCVLGVTFPITGVVMWLSRIRKI